MQRVLTLGKQQKQKLKKENLRTSHNPIKNRGVVFLFFSFWQSIKNIILEHQNISLDRSQQVAAQIAAVL